MRPGARSRRPGIVSRSTANIIITFVSSTKLTLTEWSQPRRLTLARGRSAWLVPLVAVLLAVLLLLAESRALTRRPVAHLDIDTREASLLLSGFHAIERDGRGAYRWSSGDSQIAFDPVGAGGPLALTLRLGPPPPELAAA